MTKPVTRDDRALTEIRELVWEVVSEGPECPVCTHDATWHLVPGLGCADIDGECECPLSTLTDD